MALGLEVLKQHCNVTDAVDNAVLTRLLEAAQKHVERLLGYALTDTDQLPGGAPADLEQAVYLVAAHWYENREATMVGVSAAAIPIPIGATEIVNEYRKYTFGLCDD